MTDASAPRRSGTLYWLPVILGNQSLDPTEALLLIGLADHVNAADECYVGITTLATYARVSYGTARRRLAALEQRGVIHRTARHREDGGRSVYDYRLDRDVLDPPINLRGGVRALGSAEGPAHQDARAEPPRSEPPRGERDRAEQSMLAAGFDEFWTAYPRHTAKATAVAAWPAAVRSAGSMREVIDGALRYAADPNRVPGFTAHAATWLRAERWNDDPLPARAGGPPANAARVDQDRGGPAGRVAL